MDNEIYEDPKTGLVYLKDGDHFRQVNPAAATATLGEGLAANYIAALKGLGRGAKMRAGQIIGSPELYYSGALPQWEEEETLSGLRSERPISSFAGTVAPYLAVPGAGAGLAASAGTGAALGALDPSGDPAASVYLGAAGGGAGWGGAALARAARMRGVSGALPGTAETLSTPGGLAARAQARIDAAADSAGVRAPRGPRVPIEPADSLDDLGRLGRAQSTADAAAIRAGVDPDAARQLRMQELGYDPALLGGRARTVDPGDVHAWAVEQLDNAGFELTPGQRYNNKQLLQLEASARSTPWASAPLTAIQDANQLKFNKLVNRAIGQEGDEVSLANINRAHDFVSDTFMKASSAMEARGGVPAGGLEGQIREIVEDWAKAKIDIPGDVVMQYKRADATFDAKGLLAARQRLGSLIRQAKATGETTKIEAFSDMIESIDAAVQAASRSQGEALGRAREVYRVLRVLERPGVWQQEKNVAMGPLYRALKTGFRNELRQTKETVDPAVSKLVNVVRAREAVLRDLISDSGTATRMSLQNIVAHPIQSVAQGILGRGAALAYVNAGKVGRRVLKPEGAEQLAGVWGSTW